MARMIEATDDFFADKGALIIPVSVTAGGEKRGMMAIAGRLMPGLAKAFQSARRSGFLAAGGSFAVHLQDRTVILMGLAIGPGREASVVKALNSIGAVAKENAIGEAALYVPTREDLDVAREAIRHWPSNVQVRFYHPDWDAVTGRKKNAGLVNIPELACRPVMLKADGVPIAFEDASARGWVGVEVLPCQETDSQPSGWAVYDVSREQPGELLSVHKTAKLANWAMDAEHQEI